MSYSKQSWANESAGGTPISAERLNHLEDGIDSATNVAEAAATAITSHQVAANPHPQYADPAFMQGVIASSVTGTEGVNVSSASGTTTVKVADGGISTNKVADAAITPAKLDRSYLVGQVLTSGDRVTVNAAPDGTVTVAGDPIGLSDLDPSLADVVGDIGTVAATGMFAALGDGPWTPSTHPNPPTVTLSAANAATTLTGSTSAFDRTAKSLLVRWLGPDMVDADSAEMGGRTGGLKSAPMTTTPQIYRGCMEFETDSTQFELRLYCVTTSAMGYRVWIDDLPVSAPVTGVGGGGSAYRLKVDFTAWTNPRQWRRVKIEFNVARVIGISTAPDTTIMPPSTRRKPRCSVLGDSHTEGTGATWGFLAWQNYMGVRLGWDACGYGVGATGILATATGKVKYRDRISDLPSTSDIIIVAGGYNDIGVYSPSAIQNEAALLFQAIKDQRPRARIIALSPFNSTGVTTADSRTSIRDAIKAAAVAAGVAFIDVMGYPDRPSMITGTGKVGATNGTGNSDYYVSNDGVHYSPAGYEFIGSFVASRIQEFYAAFGQQPADNTPVATVSGPYPIAFNQTTYLSKTKKVFAHFMAASNLVRNISNTNPDYYQNVYLNVGSSAEGGKHQPYACYMRDAPILRPVSSSTTWKQDDMEWECRQAQAAGIDGFTLLMSGSSGANGTTATTMIRAAEVTGHKIILMPDCNSTYALTPAGMADWLATLGTSAACYTIGGKLLVMPHYAHRQGGTATTSLSLTDNVTWWTQFKTEMSNRGKPIELWPIFDDESSRRTAFASISYGIGVWGSRSVANNVLANQTARIATAHGLGLKWCQTVAMEDERPRSSVFDEALGTQALQAQWDIAIQGDADIVQLATWNDGSEGSALYPSQNHGWRALDLLTYWIAWYKDGTAPTIGQDVVFGAHRGSFVADHGTYVNPTGGSTTYQALRSGSSAAADIVDAVWFLIAPAQCRITVGASGATTQTLGAGLQRFPTPPALAAADPASTPIKFEIIRSGTTVASVTSPYKVYANGTAPIDDRSYRLVSSARNAS